MKEDVKVLLQKYFNNECSEAEIEDNEQLLKSAIYSELEAAVDEKDMDVVDIDERLQAVYNRLKEHVGIPPVPVVRINWRRIAAAAAVLILVCAGVFYLTPRQHTVRPTAHIIAPGKNQAILRLADGSQISLNDATAGEVATQSGVSITKGANGELVYQDNSQRNDVQYNAIEVPAGGQWQIVLPDQSHVWLNAKSMLRYPTRFKGTTRTVELKGEAYFEISPDQAKPFMVMSNRHTVEVLGTHFNIMSYPDDSFEKTTLFEGAVKIVMSGNAKVLKPGEQAQISAAGIQVHQHADLEEVIAWKNGYFKFSGRLEDIMSKISRWYDVEIVYLNKPDPNYTFEGEISRNKNLNEILQIMEYTGKVHFSIKDRKIEVSN